MLNRGRGSQREPLTPDQLGVGVQEGSHNQGFGVVAGVSLTVVVGVDFYQQRLGATCALIVEVSRVLTTPTLFLPFHPRETQETGSPSLPPSIKHFCKLAI
jgi:hypothetical protein